MIKVQDGSPNLPIDCEKTIRQCLAENITELTPEAVLSALKLAVGPDAEAREQWLNRIVRMLENTEELIPIQPGVRYAAAAKLLSGKEFLIVPDAFEIERKILIPGHRFSPFMAPELFPSDIELKETGARRHQTLKKIQDSAETILKYHVFLGAESLFDFFAAEDQCNIESAQQSNNPLLTLAVFDMSKFYEETAFSEGDALVVKVTDYEQGHFEFHLDNGKDRGGVRERVYRETFENALEQVTETFAPGRTILEQLRMTFANAPELLEKPALSCDELLLKDSAFDICFDPDGSTLIWRNEEKEAAPHEHHDEDCDCGCAHDHHHHDNAENEGGVPNDLSLSSGETGSLAAMLKALYPMLNMLELDAFLLDACKNYDYDFNSFYSRAFGEAPLPFADEAQEAIFFNALEERLEEFQHHYPREFDEKCSELRGDIVDFTMERCAMLTELAALEEHPAIDQAIFTKLADATLRLDEILKIVNHPDTVPDDCNFEAMRDAADQALEDGSDALSEMGKVLDGND